MDPEPRTPSESLADSLSDSLRALTPADQEHCLALDAAALGGLWTAGQWATELAAPGRPGVGLWEGEVLVAMASGWLILEELHITLVAVDPRCRRRGLGRRGGRRGKSGARCGGGGGSGGGSGGGGGGGGGRRSSRAAFAHRHYLRHNGSTTCKMHEE